MKVNFVRLFRCLVLLFPLLVGQTAWGEGIMNSTKNITDENIQDLKNAAADLQNSVMVFQESIKGKKDEIWGKAAGEKDELLEKVKSSFESLFNGDEAQLKKLDYSNIKKNIDDLIAGVKDDANSEVNEFVSQLKDLKEKTDVLVYRAMGLFSYAYTTPIGFTSDNLKFTLSIDELRYVHSETDPNDNSVAIDAHAKWTLPWTITSGSPATTIEFAGENIPLKGGGEAKLRVKNSKGDILPITLVKDKVFLDIKKETYVEIDCNGFRSLFLDAQIRFTSEIMTYAEDKTKEVVAPFKLTFNDLSDMVIQASIDKPFKLKVTDDVIYTAKDVIADFSTISNPENFQFPENYESAFPESDIAYWTGFAIKDIEVNLTEQFPELPLERVAANNLIIDETGVSGYFKAVGSQKNAIGAQKNGNQTASAATSAVGEGARNSTIEGHFTELSLGFQSSRLTSGSLKGDVTIKPLTDDNDVPLTLELSGSLARSSNGEHMPFDIYAKVKKDLRYHLPFIKTTNITVGQGTQVEYHRESKESKRFVLNMNGGLDVKNKLIEIEGLKFVNMRISSASPHFSPGTFSVNSVGSPLLHGLPIGVKGLSSKESRIDEKTGEELAVLTPTAYLHIIPKEGKGDDKQGAAVEATFDLMSSIDSDKWSIKGLQVHAIKVNVDYSSFHLGGYIEAKKDDEMFGDYFGGSLEFSMKTPRIGCTVEGKFGKTSWTSDGSASSPYKYWLVSANATIPPILLFPPAVFMNSISLAAYSKIGYTYDDDECKIKDIYPDKKKKFGFQAGIGIYAVQENLINGRVTMGIDFSSSGGLETVFLSGHVGVLGTDMHNAFLDGYVKCHYDFQNEVFNFDVSAYPGDKIKNFVDGKASLKLRCDPVSWYCRAGTPTDPVFLDFVGIVSSRSYLMLGDSLPTSIPPMDSRLSGMFNVTQSSATSSDHSAEFNNGTGFAFGAALEFGVHLRAFVYADLEFLGGIDVLVLKNKIECENSYYRAHGHMYLYLDADLGIKFARKKFSVLELTAATDLSGEVPKPLFVHGNIGFKYKVGVLKGRATAKYKTGKSCALDPDSEGGKIFNAVITSEEEDPTPYEDD